MLFYQLRVTFHLDCVLVLQRGSSVLDEVEERSGVTTAAVRVVSQPQSEVGPVHQTVQVVDVGLLELRDLVLVQVELLQVGGQTAVLEHADLVSGEEEFGNVLVEPGALVLVVVSGHCVGQIFYLVTRQVQNYLIRLITQY